MVRKKEKQVRLGAKKLTVTKPKRKVRLAIECTPEERKYLKMHAAHEEKTLNEYVLDCVRKEMFGCSNPHIPNKTTEKVLDEIEEGVDLVQFDSVDDFLDSLDR